MSHAKPNADFGAEPTERRKSVGDYLKALRRRFWLVMLIALLLGGGGTLVTLFVQSPIYLANAVVRIEPPKALVKELSTGMNPAMATGYFNTRVEMIASRKVAEQVIQELKLSDWRELYGVDDPTAELMGWIKVKPRRNSNLVDVSLEGRDAQIVHRIVNATVEAFQRFENESIDLSGNDAAKQIKTELEVAQGKLRSATEALITFRRDKKSFLLGEKTNEELHMEDLIRRKSQLDVANSDTKRRLAGLKTLLESGAAPMSLESQKVLGQIKADIVAIDEELEYYKWRLKPKQFEISRHVQMLNEQRDRLLEQMDGIGQGEYEFELKRTAEMLKLGEEDATKLTAEIAGQQKLISDQLEDRKQFASLVAAEQSANKRRDELAAEWTRALSQGSLMGANISIEERAVLPRTPIRPILWVQIPLCILGGFFIGALVVILLEMSDGTIREPSQAQSALHWPLLGVVPRINRRELMTGHGKFLLASELPGSQVCEAFRNLRMSLVGLGADRHRSLLVASPKVGEGKSLVAANLAAACARAGESVVLVDIDLRHPSIDDYFDVPADTVGLVEVLEGEIPWQNALVETEVPNLHIMPVGNADGAPLDILGTVEMHDLVGELTEKFDRVILDGPAVLGIADARAVGRFVNGVLLVMRAGSHDSRPLARIRELFEQEGLRPAGIVFNGMKEYHEDLAENAVVQRRRREYRPYERERQPENTPAETEAEIVTEPSTVNAA